MSPPPSRRATTSARREAILSAALACFEEQGYTAATLDDIRRRSGASIGSIYHHFPGKEQIAGALYLEALRDYQDGLLQELERHREAASGVRAVVAYHLAWVREHPVRARYLHAMRGTPSVDAVEPEIEALNRLLFERFAAWLRPHVRGGAIVRLPADCYTPVWLGPAQDFVRRWLSGQATTGIEQAEEILATAAWNALRRQGAVRDMKGAANDSARL